VRGAHARWVSRNKVKGRSGVGETYEGRGRGGKSKGVCVKESDRDKGWKRGKEGKRKRGKKREKEGKRGERENINEEREAELIGIFCGSGSTVKDVAKI
jgi:hypothetical protein